MSNVVQFRRTTAILTLVAASIGGGLIAAFAVMNHSNTPVAVVARADTNAQRTVSQLSNSFADVIEKASPAVVEISMTRVIKAPNSRGTIRFSQIHSSGNFSGARECVRATSARRAWDPA
jgi:S1-C subfamily serine protease